jgi:hypothetical protein
MRSYLHFKIETFELGPDQWHACLRCIDRKQILIDGISLTTLHVGLAWPAEAALADAQGFIDRMIGRLDIAA